MLQLGAEVREHGPVVVAQLDGDAHRAPQLDPQIARARRDGLDHARREGVAMGAHAQRADEAGAIDAEPEAAEPIHRRVPRAQARPLEPMEVHHRVRHGRALCVVHAARDHLARGQRRDGDHDFRRCFGAAELDRRAGVVVPETVAGPRAPATGGELDAHAALLVHARLVLGDDVEARARPVGRVELRVEVDEGHTRRADGLTLGIDDAHAEAEALLLGSAVLRVRER